MLQLQALRHITLPADHTFNTHLKTDRQTSPGTGIKTRQPLPSANLFWFLTRNNTEDKLWSECLRRVCLCRLLWSDVSDVSKLFQCPWLQPNSSECNSTLTEVSCPWRPESIVQRRGDKLICLTHDLYIYRFKSQDQTIPTFIAKAYQNVIMPEDCGLFCRWHIKSAERC